MLRYFVYAVIKLVILYNCFLFILSRHYIYLKTLPKYTNSGVSLAEGSSRN